MTFLNTVPANIRPREEFAAWRHFHVGNGFEQADWLRRISQNDVPVSLGVPGGDLLTVSLWSVDVPNRCLYLGAEPTGVHREALPGLLAAPEVWGAAYIADQKIQFLVGQVSAIVKADSIAIACHGPLDMYRLARRNGLRVKRQRHACPVAQLPESLASAANLALLVVDVSEHGCALSRAEGDWTPVSDQVLRGVEFEFDDLTYLIADLQVRHVTPETADPTRLRIGCTWLGMSGQAREILRRWMERGRRRHGVLSIDLD